ncbi:hypothetical protein Pmani_015033 [Petrolisthes manimaculis]|uniref:Ionotropic glutamate receptor C-terminal domain-containing protein n=1 Tax=Petrolisthes manimaculis TaxID=1843537 RepID=A0AAE1PSQ7_9EUCA|nr:hypothetical protein Pmani_015033 [Petrolisthes manimaculis]
MVIGGRPYVKDVLLHRSFRNTINALYLAIHPDTLATTYTGLLSHSRHIYQVGEPHVWREAWLYRRCLYCNNGESGVRYIYHWKHNHFLTNVQLFHGDVEFKDLGGHSLRYIAVHYFPYIAFTPDTDQPLSKVTPIDSLDYRLILAFSEKMNYTYSIYGEPDNSWGEDIDGEFSGLCGYLQREEFDVSTIIVPTALRLKAANFIRSYPTDLMTVISLKPQPLPKHLAFIRPFTGTVWVAILVSVMVWGILLWLLTRTRSHITGDESIQLNTALLYGWGALLAVPPPDPSVSTSGQMMVGWWLLFCLVFFTGFQSTLISHLTVNRARTRPPETMEDLVKADGWKWGIEPWILSGIPLEYFTRHTDPVVIKIYKEIEVLNADEALEKVSKGQYSLLDLTYYITIHVLSYYADANGHTPFYISKNGFTFMSTFGWGVRYGAPFYHRFHKLTLQLEATGITNHWLQELITQRVKENRAKTHTSQKERLNQNSEELNGGVVLGLDHLQGAFYLLFLGSGVALVMLVAELFFSITPQAFGQLREII